MKRIIFLGIVFVILLYFAKIEPEKLFERFQGGKQEITSRIADSRISIGYILDQTSWTVFTLNPESTLIKILTNANFPSSFNPIPEQRWWYELQYQILDSKENILLDQRYYHHTRITKYVDRETQQVFESRFYLNKNLLPADVNILMINLSGIEDAAFIQFRLAWKDPLIHDVLLRAYLKEKTSERTIAYLWHRFSEDQKENLSRGNVYPYDLLTAQEQYNLVRHLWQPIGPFGIEGQDYESRKLYVLKEIEGEGIVSFPVLPQGLFIDRSHRGIVSIPEGGGKVRLEFTHVGEYLPHKEDHVHLRWFGTEISKRSEHLISWAEHGARFEKFFTDGLLEIETTHDVIVRTFLVKGEQTEEITPEPLYVRTYVTHGGMPVTFYVSHIQKKMTPFRVDFRYLISEELNQTHRTPPTVSYQLLTEQGKTVKEGEIALLETASLYDRIHGDMSGMIVSEVLRQFFSLPVDITRIRFISKQPVLIAAYNRPPDLLKHTRVPEDYHKYHLKDESRQPTWFAIQPVDSQHLVLEDRSLLLTVQYRPPEDRPEIVAGQYKWEVFYPEDSWVGRYLFTPREPGGLIRKEQLQVIYRWLPIGKEIVLSFQQTVKGLQTVEPKMFFLRESIARVPLEIFVDDRLYYKITLSGTRGEFQLPPLSVGEHRIKVSAPEDITCYVNYAGSEEESLLKRFANRIDRSGLRFMYEKTHSEEDILLIHFFAPANHSDTTVIRIEVNAKSRHPSKPLADWTLLHRQYRIRPYPGNPVPVLHTQNEFVDQGRLFFLPLGSDLPPGPYPIRVTLEQGSEGYLIFSKITLGIFEKRDFFRERRLVNDEILE